MLSFACLENLSLPQGPKESTLYARLSLTDMLSLLILGDFHTFSLPHTSWRRLREVGLVERERGTHRTGSRFQALERVK